MKIAGIGIDGFGKFRGKRFDALGDGLNVFYGPNEAGKSSLLAFIQAMLYGFPRQRRDAHYPPLNGGLHGGRLLLEKHGELYVLHRHAATAGKDLQLTLPDGTESRSEDVVRQLLGGASRDVYNTVFAFSLRELQEIDSLAGDEISAQIYSAGLGAGSVPAALAALKAREDDLFKKRGRKHELAGIAQELTEVRQRIGRRKQDDEQYARLERERAELESRAGSTAANIESLRKYEMRLRRLVEIRPAWATWRRLSAQIAEVEVPRVPADAVARVESLEQTLRECEQRRVRSEREWESTQAALEGCVVDGAVLEFANEIEVIEAGKQSHAEALRDLPRREAELVGLQAQLQAALAEMGSGWTIERVAKLDTSAAVKQRIAACQQEIERARREADNARLRLETVETEAADVASELEQAVAARERIMPPEATVEALLDRKATLQRAAAQPDSIAAREPMTATIAVTGAGVAAAVVVGGFAVAGWAGALLGALAAGGMLLALQRLTGTDGSHRSQTGFDDGVEEHGGIDTAMREVERDLELHQVRAGADATVREVQARVARIRARVERARELTERYADELEAVTGRWRATVASMGLDEETAPVEALDLIAQARLARDRQLAVDAMAHRVAAIEGNIRRYDEQVAEVWRSLYPGAEPVAGAASTFTDTLSRAREASRERNRLQDEIKRCGVAMQDCVDAEREASEAYATHLERWNAADADALRLMAEAWREREALLQEVRQYEARVAQGLGGGDDFESLSAELETSDPDAMALELEGMEAEISELQRNHDESLTALGSVERELRELRAGHEMSALLAKREALQTQAERLAREWATTRVARLLIERARARYESERQPAVIKSAQAYFEAMTLGRYRQIIAPLGEESVRVVDRDGAEKNPEQLSRGTREQLYLALRFGLIEQFTERSGPLPIVVDEVMVNFDLARAREAAAGFAKLAERHQVIAFTCHEWVVDLFREADPGANVWSLGEAVEHEQLGAGASRGG